METLLNCPVCNASESKAFIKCTDYTVSKELFTIVVCSVCNFKYTNPRPKSDEIGKYYESEEYVSHSNTSKGLINKIYKSVRKYALSKKVSLINKYIINSNEKSVFDIGCGTGEFLNACKLNGWNTIGIEPNKSARNLGKTNYSLNIFEEDYLDQLKDKSFDIITMWHVLEHVHELNNKIDQLRRLLKDDGTIIIAVPNCDSKDAEIYTDKWAAYDVPRHLYHFVPDSMNLLLKNHTLNIIKKLPMIFDSFYVSMLSEKYKLGKVNLVSAIINGLKSNIKASKNDVNYSSIIYIVKKMV
jgi:2-polyprenyl-3-methyl-5-hydroxy-6-metoxy-1,4-benzoquinol methylase